MLHQRQRLLWQAREIVNHHDNPRCEEAAAGQISETAVSQVAGMDLCQLGIRVLALGLGHPAGRGSFGNQGLRALDEHSVSEDR